MNKKKVLLTSILTIILCLSVVAGATFALFTSKDEDNIVITSGKVNIEATMIITELYSPKAITMAGEISDVTNIADNANHVFANGGTAKVEGATLKLVNMTPGDKVNFQIKITNNSNIATLYRTITMLLNDNGLFSALNVEINGFNGATKYTNWEELSVETKEIVLDCSVELPAKVGDTYQEKTCEIAFIVEAVQGNTEVTDAVAEVYETDDKGNPVGDVTEFATLEGAIEAVNATKDKKMTVKITRPGVYAPFTVTAPNVTVTGIVSDDYATSTVIKTTATECINVPANNVTLDHLYIDATTKYVGSGNVYDIGIINGNTHADSSTFSAKITVSNCAIYGEGTNNLIDCKGAEIIFTDNVVDNFYRIAISHNEKVALTATYTGNKIMNVGYEAIIMNAYIGSNFVFTGNTVVGSTMISLNNCSEGAIADATVKNNTVIGNVIYRLGWFNSGKTATPHTVECGANEKVVYFMPVSIDLKGGNYADYQILKIDGNFTPDLGHNGNVAAADSSVLLEVGDYYLVEKATGFKCATFTVTAPVAGEQQVATLGDEVLIYTAEDMLNIAKAVNENNDTLNGKTFTLMNDIDLAGIAWKPIGNVNKYPSCTFAGTFDGNGKTISNMSATAIGDNGVAAAGLFGSITGVVKNLTVDKATVVSSHYAGGIVGFSSTNNGMKIENCKVTNSTILSAPELVDAQTNKYDNGDKVGGIIGYMVAGDMVDKCVVENVSLTGYRDIGGIVGHAAGTVQNCAVKNISLHVDKTHNYKGYTTDAEFDCNNIVGENAKATLKNNTVNGVVEEEIVAPATLEELKAAIGEAVTQKTSSIIINLTQSFDAEGNWEAFSPKGYSGVTNVTINGNGHTLYNMNAPLIVGSFAGNGTVTINI